LPGSPNDFTQSPFLSYLATRALTYPSLMKMSPCAFQRHVGWLPEHAVDWRQRRIERPAPGHRFVGRFLLSAEHHDDMAVRIELDDHVRPLVHRPDVVVLVDPDRVGIGKGVQSPADFTEELPIGAELEELRGRRAEGRTGNITASEDEDVALGVDRHPGALAQVHVGG
jgi:hypothetical protein